MHGFGVIKGHLGNYYGNFSFGGYNGHGIFEDVNGDIYIGEFTDNLYHGEGELIRSNGDVYTGNFSNHI